MKKGDEHINTKVKHSWKLRIGPLMAEHKCLPFIAYCALMFYF